MSRASPTGLLRSLALLALVLGALACRQDEASREFDSATSTSAQAAYPSDYVLMAELVDFAGYPILLSNGFPVERLPGFVTSVGQRVGERLAAAQTRPQSRAGLRVEPYAHLIGPERVAFGPVRFALWIEHGQPGDRERPVVAELGEPEVSARFASWQQRADSAQAALVAEGAAGQELLRAMRRWAERNPFVVEARFTAREGPDFSALFGQSAPVIAGTPADSARLRGYALRLRELVASQNFEALYDEIAISASDSLGWAPLTADPEATRQQKVASLERYNRYRTDWGAEHVRLRSWSGGRLWEIYLRGAAGPERTSPLFFADGLPGIAVFVGQRQDGLRVVRRQLP